MPLFVAILALLSKDRERLLEERVVEASLATQFAFTIVPSSAKAELAFARHEASCSVNFGLVRCGLNLRIDALPTRRSHGASALSDNLVERSRRWA